MVVDCFFFKWISGFIRDPQTITKIMLFLHKSIKKRIFVSLIENFNLEVMISGARENYISKS
jgi:hypothetical protein